LNTYCTSISSPRASKARVGSRRVLSKEGKIFALARHLNE
jgi:hypothetical protein